MTNFQTLVCVSHGLIAMHVYLRKCSIAVNIFIRNEKRDYFGFLI